MCTCSNFVDTHFPSLAFAHIFSNYNHHMKVDLYYMQQIRFSDPPPGSQKQALRVQLSDLFALEMECSGEHLR